MAEKSPALDLKVAMLAYIAWICLLLVILWTWGDYFLIWRLLLIWWTWLLIRWIDLLRLLFVQVFQHLLLELHSLIVEIVLLFFLNLLLFFFFVNVKLHVDRNNLRRIEVQSLHFFFPDKLYQLSWMVELKLLRFLVDLGLYSLAWDWCVSEFAPVIERAAFLILDEIVKCREKLYCCGSHTPVVNVVEKVDTFSVSQIRKQIFQKEIVGLLHKL